MIPILDLKAQYGTIQSEIKTAIDEVLSSQQFILGPQVKKLEETIASYCDVAHAIGVASGSDALLLALMAADVGSGDEVITTPFTFFATAGAIVRLGAKPVFVDIEPKTFNIDPKGIEAAITKRTKAIIAVHLYGQCADMDPILKIAKSHRLMVVEDAAQAIGSLYKNKKAGSLGHMGCFSFFPTKNLGAYGDGGMITTNDGVLADKLRKLRVHGSSPKYYHSMVGICSRLDSIQAAVLLVKMKYLDGWSKQRRVNAQQYNMLLKSSKVQTPFVETFNEHIFHQYVIRAPYRNDLRQYLEKAGIQTEIYYPLSLHMQECFKKLKYHSGDFPCSERASDETLALPIYPELTKAQQEEVVLAINRFYQTKV